MAEDSEAIANVRARAFTLARTGSYWSWARVRDALIGEGYLETFNPCLADDGDFRRDLDAACEQARTGMKQ